MRLQKIPKFLEKIFFFFPILHLALFIFAIFYVLKSTSLASISFFLFISYFLAPLIWRFARLFFDQPIGIGKLGKKAKGGNPWYIAYQLQKLYNSHLWLERSIKLIPGLYSAWLRLWGSKIGKKVNWVAGAQVLDRTHLIVGDRCLFGHQCCISSHAIKKQGDTYSIYVNNVTIGDDCVVSYLSTISPGVVMGNSSFLEAGGVLYPNKKLKEGEVYARFQELSD